MTAARNYKIVLIGASTGGPGVIEKIITALPDNFPYPICIVQHFPADLTSSFVARLQTCTSNKVVESSEGLALDKGMVVIAKGGTHMEFAISENKVPVVTHAKSGIRNDFIPSVDVMMFSASTVYDPASILAVLLTGIGDDGANAMARIKSIGGMSVCQDEKSSAVFGMPGRAIERGGACKILSIDEVSQTIKEFGRE